jgi:hypothetical protein
MERRDGSATSPTLVFSVQSKQNIAGAKRNYDMKTLSSEAVTCWPLTADAWVRTRVSPRGICGGQTGNGTGSSPISSAFISQHHSTEDLHTHIMWGWTMGPFEESLFRTLSIVQCFSLKTTFRKLALLTSSGKKGGKGTGLRLALSKGPHRVSATPSPLFYLKREAEPVSETFLKKNTGRWIMS